MASVALSDPFQHKHQRWAPREGWGRVKKKKRAWPPHMPGTFQRLTPEQLSCVLIDKGFHFNHSVWAFVHTRR